MAKRVSQNLGERIVTSEYTYVSETRKDVFLNKRQEAQLYRINRAFLWAKSIGARTALTDNLVNMSYGVLQTLNDISAFFVTDNLTKSLAARYAWTKGGKFLAGIQNKVVPSGYGPISRALRVQAGRQSKNILAGLSSKFFVNTEMKIHNVKNFELEIKKQIAYGQGVGRKWQLMTAANAISSAPDPYQQAAKIMGGYSKRNMTSETGFQSNQIFLKDAGMLRNLMSEGMNVSEANHYLKFMKTGQNPNSLVEDYRQAMQRRDNSRSYIANIRTGETRDVEDLIRNLDNKIAGVKPKLNESYNKRRKEGDNSYVGKRYVGRDEEGRPKYANTYEYPSFGFNTAMDNDAFLGQYTTDEIDDLIDRMIMDRGSTEKYGGDLENYGQKYKILYDLARNVSLINRARSAGHRGKMPVKKDLIAKNYAKLTARGANFKDVNDVQDALQWLNVVSMSIHGAENPKMGNNINSREDAERLAKYLLGTDDIDDFQEMGILTGNPRYKDGRLDTLGFGTKYGVAKITNQKKGSNGYTNSNYIPSKRQIQDAIHIIEPDLLPGDKAFLLFAVSFGGKTGKSKYADAIEDAQQIEYGGPATTTVTPYIYPRTLFLNNAAYRSAQALGIEAPFRTTINPSASLHTLQNLKPREKDKGFNLVVDQKMKKLLSAENSVRHLRGRTGRVRQLNPVLSLFDDPLMEDINRADIARQNIDSASAIRQLRNIESKRYYVDVLEDGSEVVRSEELIPLSALHHNLIEKTEGERINDAIKRAVSQGLSSEQAYLRGASVANKLMNRLRKEINFQQGPIKTRNPETFEWVYTTRIPRRLAMDMELNTEASIMDYIDYKYNQDREIAIKGYESALKGQQKSPQQLRDIAIARASNNRRGKGPGFDVAAEEERIFLELVENQQFELEIKMQEYENKWDAEYDRHWEQTMENVIDDIGNELLTISKLQNQEALRVYNSTTGKFESAPNFAEVTQDIEYAFNEANTQYLESRKAQGEDIRKILSSKEYKDFLNAQREILMQSYNNVGIDFRTLAGGEAVITVFEDVDSATKYEYTAEMYERDKYEGKLDRQEADIDVYYEIAGQEEYLGNLYGNLPDDYRDSGVFSDPVVEEVIRKDPSFVRAFETVVEDLRRTISGGTGKRKGWTLSQITGEVVSYTNEDTGEESVTYLTPEQSITQALKIIAGDLADNKNVLTMAFLIYGKNDYGLEAPLRAIFTTSESEGERIFAEVSNSTIREVFDRVQRLRAIGTNEDRRRVKQVYDEILRGQTY